MDGLNAPLKVRQARLGHVNPATTLGYTHRVGEDDRRVSAQLGTLIHAKTKKETRVQWFWTQLDPKTKLGRFRTCRKLLDFRELFGCGGWI